MADTPENISEAFMEAGSAPAPVFQYGACTTNHRDKMGCEPTYLGYYASEIERMLDKLGLPFPQKNEIFSGTSDDLLFLNSHGVVIRIGRIDIPQMMSPALVQPLGWLTDNSITVAVYPGIELYKHWQKKDDKPPLTDDIATALRDSGQMADDLHEANIGIIRVLDAGGAGSIGRNGTGY